MLALHYRPRRTDRNPSKYGATPRITAGTSTDVGPTSQLMRPPAAKHQADNANKYRAQRPAPSLKIADLPPRYSENGASSTRGGKSTGAPPQPDEACLL